MRRDRTEGVEDYQEGDGQDHVAQRPQGVPKRLFLRIKTKAGLFALSNSPRKNLDSVSSWNNDEA
jgi:hypothetical protein